MQARIKTRTNVSVEVWSVKCDANGQPLKDGKGQPILDQLRSYQRLHNTTATTMLNYKVYYLTQETTTKPVNRIKFLYNSSASYAYETTSYTNASYATTWTAAWTNTTGSTQTVDTVQLVSFADTGVIVFCTASPAQSVANYEVMRVTWTHTHTATTSGTGANYPTIDAAALTMVRDCLTGARTTSDPIYSMTFTGGSTSTIVYLGTPFSGGSLSDTSVVWKPTATSGAGNTQLIAYYIYLKSGSTYGSKTGLTTAWVAAQTITATITVTMA